jgi:hypothetical protein
VKNSINNLAGDQSIINFAFYPLKFGDSTIELIQWSNSGIEDAVDI